MPFDGKASLGISVYLRKIALWFGKKCTVVYYNDVIMDAMASQNTSFTIVYLTVYSGADQRKPQSIPFSIIDVTRFIFRSN